MTESARRLREAARRLGAHEASRRLAGAALSGIGASAALLALLVGLTRVVPLDRDVPRVALGIAALGFVAAIALPLGAAARAWWRRRPAARDPEESARRTEVQIPALRDRLVAALQILRVRDESRTGYSAELVDAVADGTVGDVEAVRPGTLPYNAIYRRGVRAALAGSGLLVLVGLVLGPAAAWRGLVDVASAGTRLGPRPHPSIDVHPGDTSVPRGSSVHLAADVRHAMLTRGAAHGALEWREGSDGPWREVALSAVGGTDGDVPTARFEHEVADVKESFRYRFRHGGAVSGEYAVEAVTAPSLAIEQVRYRYPAYTGLPERILEDGGGDLAALRGTRAEIVVRSTNEPRRGALRLGSGAEVPLAIEPERRLRGTLDIRADDTYVLFVEDALGLANPNPLEYRVRSLPDEAPFIRLLEPGEDRDLDESMQETLRFSALDDYGLGPVELVWEVSRRPGAKPRAVVLTPEGIRTEIDARWAWDLSTLDLLPGDTVVYHLEVRDNNAIDGPSRSRTRDYVLRFPTLGEVFAQMDDEHKSSVEELSDALDEAKKIESKVEEISRDLLKQGESSWESGQEVQRALEAQERLADKLRDTRERIESGLQQLTESETATLDALQKMERIRELLDEVATKEMKEALEKLREALEEQNPYQKQQDLSEFDRTQEELMRQLDRIVENLEQFRLDEKMKAAVRRLEELAARQEGVNDELSRAEDSPDEEKSEAGREGETRDAPPDEAKEAGTDEAGEERPAEPEAPADSAAADTGRESGSPEAEAGENRPQEESSKSSGEEGAEKKPESDLERMAQEEKSLAEETRDLEKELEDLAEMTERLRQQRDAQEMSGLAEQMKDAQIPQTMDDMAESLQQGQSGEAGEKGEKALTELRDLLTQLQGAQQGMAMRMIQVSQAAINRAVRDLLSLSTDQETLASDVANIPRNSSSATRAFADEQQLLIRGAERVRDMLQEVAKDTPLMESSVGRNLEAGISSMRDAADGLESGAVQLADGEGGDAVRELNAVVIDLLRTSQQMSSCSSGMPMQGLMQQLQELSQDQQKLNEALRKLREQGGGSLDQRLQAQLRDLAQEQQRIREQLDALLKEIGGGEGLLGRLDDVSQKLDEVARKLAEGNVDDSTLRDQEWALTRLLDSQRSMRERDFGRERQSKTGEQLGEVAPPSALPEGLDDVDRDLREDLLKALERRYPPKYEDLIRRYFRELSREVPAPDLP